jgi:hypothetical protein
LRLRFAGNVSNAASDNPNNELALLLDVAKQLKQNDGSIRYAHPNWIAGIGR